MSNLLKKVTDIFGDDFVHFSSEKWKEAVRFLNELSMKEKVDLLKKAYPSGTKIFLYHMDGEESQMPYGLKGTVLYVDDIGQIHMQWENKSVLALNPEIDVFSVIQ